MGVPHSSVGKESAYNAGDLGSIPGQGTNILQIVRGGQKKKKDTDELIYERETDSQT